MNLVTPSLISIEPVDFDWLLYGMLAVVYAIIFVVLVIRYRIGKSDGQFYALAFAVVLAVLFATIPAIVTVNTVCARQDEALANQLGLSSIDWSESRTRESFVAKTVTGAYLKAHLVEVDRDTYVVLEE